VLDDDGTGKFRVSPERTGYFWVEVAATDQQTAAASDAMRTRVRWKVKVDSREYTAVKRETVTLAAALSPAQAGVTVRLQKFTDDGWSTIRKITTDGNGRIEGNVRVLKPKTVVYRFVAGNNDGYIRGVSPKITLEVTSGS
jgi:hypothetical protein